MTRLSSPLLRTLGLVSSLGLIYLACRPHTVDSGIGNNPHLLEVTAPASSQASTATKPTGDESVTPAGNPAIRQCHEFHEQIETLPMSALLSDLKSGKLSVPGFCPQEEKTQKLFADLQHSCKPGPFEENLGECHAALFQFRARRIQMWSENQDLQSLSTDHILQRFYGLIATGDVFLPGVEKQVREMAEELKLRLPESSTPYRMELLTYVFEPNLTPEQSLAFEKVLQQARQREPQDWQLFEISLLKKSKENYLDYEIEVSELLETNPQSPVGLYHAGCIAWNEGRREQALNFFKEAQAHSQNDQRIQQTLSRAQSEASGSAICSLTLSFQPENL